MRRLSLLLFVTLAVTAYAQSSKLTKFGAPVPASVEGYDKGDCITLPKNIRVCKLLSDDKDTFLVQKDGKNKRATLRSYEDDLQVLWLERQKQ